MGLKSLYCVVNTRDSPVQAVLAVAVGGAALLVLDAINLTLILFAKAWKFEDSGYWLIPEIALLFAFALGMYIFYSGKRWIRVRRKAPFGPTEHSRLVPGERKGSGENVFTT